MKIFRHIEDIPDLSKNTTAAIGNFDGVHLGHQKILRFLVKESTDHDLVSLVLTFSPHPEKFFGEKKVQMIQTLNQRLLEIKRFNIQMALVLPFSHKIANLSSREFVQSIVCDSLKAKKIIVGENFQFGKDREGNVSKLKELSALCGFRTFAIATEKKDSQIVSSSQIRAYLHAGEMEKASGFLGRPYEILGTVIKGQSRGKELGYPTANIATANEILPSGVFLTKSCIGGISKPSLTNVGCRPTFGQKETHIETHIIGFAHDLYGQSIQIQFLKKLRNEIKFENPEQLAAQIKRDLDTAKSHFRLT